MHPTGLFSEVKVSVLSQPGLFLRPVVFSNPWTAPQLNATFPGRKVCKTYFRSLKMRVHNLPHKDGLIGEITALGFFVVVVGLF